MSQTICKECQLPCEVVLEKYGSDGRMVPVSDCCLGDYDDVDGAPSAEAADEIEFQAELDAMYQLLDQLIDRLYEEPVA